MKLQKYLEDGLDDEGVIKVLIAFCQAVLNNKVDVGIRQDSIRYMVDILNLFGSFDEKMNELLDIKNEIQSHALSPGKESNIGLLNMSAALNSLITGYRDNPSRWKTGIEKLTEYLKNKKFYTQENHSQMFSSPLRKKDKAAPSIRLNPN